MFDPPSIRCAGNNHAMTAYANRFESTTRLGRHRHAIPYMALVLQGGYLEAGEHGRICVGAGNVVYHQAHGAHLNDFGGRGAVVLNLPLDCQQARVTGVIDNPDAVVRAAERDVRDAAALLAEQFRATDLRLRDWPDQLAEALGTPTFIGLAEWARWANLAPQSVSRGFRRAYGVSPKRYRAESRALAAVAGLGEWCGPLAHLAADHGFADQAHMARAMRMVTGMTPSALRVQSVQA